MFYLFLFRERGREGEREWTPPTGDLARNPGTCPDQELNLWPFDTQAGTQSSEPHQPGLYLLSIVLLHTSSAYSYKTHVRHYAKLHRRYIKPQLKRDHNITEGYGKRALAIIIVRNSNWVLSLSGACPCISFLSVIHLYFLSKTLRVHTKLAARKSADSGSPSQVSPPQTCLQGSLFLLSELTAAPHGSLLSWDVSREPK